MKKYNESKGASCPEWMSYTDQCSPVDKNWATMNIDRDLDKTFMDGAEEVIARNKRAYNVTEIDD